MRKFLFISIVAFQLIGCISTKGQKLKVQNTTGVYQRQKSSEKLEFKSDGTYTLWNAEISFTPVIEQCDYASKGKWSVIAYNVLEITSEDYYTKQKGFEYEIKKQNKFSQDSLYIQVIFPTDFHSVKLDFTFNHDNSKSVITDKAYMVLPKSKHLWNRRTAANQIGFSLNADVSGTELYNGRILFKIFEESIDTEKYNYLTITLPNFDRCFFEFEPYYQELIYIKGRNQLLWRGEIWKK
ncbi:hypothetical protein [Sphingobacterium sp. CZ-2]|uniref:hypothetical protein n=1 Tax=Sphingobacterium sp. CZ-2 TaxID=2557994 RepID=UPI00106F77EF|nr:hypothetical protein [Sphingobacterium sp. CZ-2]QBR12181.1 hypothetical protein E3D81_08410 [Sphingobacterium sp. CZ-2]